MSNKRGRAWFLKKIIAVIPFINNSELVFKNAAIPLDLRNDADIGYFYGQGIGHEKFYEELLLSLLDKTTVFCDIGSNIGYYSLLLSSSVDQVYAFEPNPIVVKRFKDVVTRYSLQNIEVFNIGVSNVNSNIPFHFNPSSHNLGSFIEASQNQTQSLVEVKRLADIIRDNELKIPHILKIDTEGSELDILEGYSLLQLDLPIVFLEWMPPSEQDSSMSERLFYLLGGKYDVYRIGVERKLTPYERQDMTSSNLVLVPKKSDKIKLMETWIN